MDREITVHETSLTRQADLTEGYRQMAADREQEAIAEVWVEALIADVATDEGYGLQPVH
jgi:hypothetical protein